MPTTEPMPPPSPSISTPEAAILGASPVVQRSFPEWPQHSSLEVELLRQTVSSGSWWRMTGTQVRQFEKDFARAHGARHGIAVTNGTHAIALALEALGIGPGDEVIVPSLTFVATAMPVFSLGAKPIPVDVLADTWCMDPAAVQGAMGPATKAVMPVHFAGQAADMAAIEDICKDASITLIEDAAHAHGGRWGGRPVGSFGQMSAFSFQNFKLLTAGEGGILLINDDDLYERATLISNCGRPAGDTSYAHPILGSNYRMSEFQGAVLNAQLTRLDELAEKREENAALLIHELSQLDGIHVQKRDVQTNRHSYYMFVFTFDAELFAGMSRNLLVEALVAEGVPAFRMYPRIQDTGHFLPCWSRVGGATDQLPASPVSSALADNGIWIHHRALLGDPQCTDQIVKALRRIQRYAAKIVATASAAS